MIFSSLRVTRYSLLACVLLTACKIGPDYTVPKAKNLPESWREAKSADGKPLYALLDEKSLAEAMWWKSFNDPVLDDIIVKGVSQNFDLKIANARISEARAQLASVKSDLLPQVNIAGSAEREANEVVFPGFSVPKPFDIFQTGFDASWELDVFGGNRRALESARALFGAARATRDDVRISVLAEIARNYINVRRYQAQEAITGNIVKANQEALKITKDLFGVGSAIESDVINAENQLSQAQAQALTYQSLLAASEYALDLLLGEHPGATHALVTPVKPIPVADKQFVLNAPATVIANRPDIRIAERNLAASTSEIGVAKSKLFPDISIAGFFGFLSTSSGTLLTAQSKAWNINGNVTWPILNYGKISAGIHYSEAQQQEALETYKKSVTAALVDVETSLSSYNKQEENRTLADKIVSNQTHAEAIANQRYKTGVTSLMEALAAQKNLYAAQLQQADATAFTSQDFVAVYKSLGGGWKAK